MAIKELLINEFQFSGFGDFINFRFDHLVETVGWGVGLVLREVGLGEGGKEVAALVVVGFDEVDVLRVGELQG